MENGNAITCVCARRYIITSFITLSIIANVIFYKSYCVQQSCLLHIGHQQCAWSKTKTKISRSFETPPWLLLLADYKNATASGRNLYVWPDVPARLGNRLFAYATTFGIAWQNRRIPIWPIKTKSKYHDIAKFFNLRIPLDNNNAIINVSLILFSNL